MVENMAPNTTLPSSMNVPPAAHRLRIALVCSRLPLPMTRADQLTVAHLISYLAARGHSLDLFTLDTGEKLTPEQRAWLDQRCRQLLVFRQPMARSILGLIRAVAVGKPMQVGWFTNRAHIRAVQQAISLRQYDVAYAYYIRSAEALRAVCPAGAEPDLGRPPTMLGMQLSQSLNTRRLAKDSGRLRDKIIYAVEQGLVRRYEANIWRDFFRTVLISERDAEEIRLACRERSVSEISNYILSPHGVDTSRFRPRPDIDPDPATLVFSGVMGTNTNIHAITWFAKNCWPRIRAEIPSTRLLIVGRRPAREVVRLAAHDRAITVTGEVPDPAEDIARATVCINPMQIGAGMQNKLIEYMACGKAVVTTPVANEGIHAISGTHLLEAAGAEAFADAVVALLRNPEMRAALGKSAREYIQRYWTWEKLFSELESEMLAMASRGLAATA
jgi:glycosyltransferase involved in cell wall biosynthesis